MQATQEVGATQKAVLVISILAMVTWFSVGCGKTEKPEPVTPAAAEAPKAVETEKWEPETVAPAAAEAPKAVETEKWEPETVTQPKVHSDDEHDGHDHGPGGHSH